MLVNMFITELLLSSSHSDSRRLSQLKLRLLSREHINESSEDEEADDHGVVHDAAAMGLAENNPESAVTIKPEKNFIAQDYQEKEMVTNLVCLSQVFNSKLDQYRYINDLFFRCYCFSSITKFRR